MIPSELFAKVNKYDINFNILRSHWHSLFSRDSGILYRLTGFDQVCDILPNEAHMNDQELNRAVQYVTASTSYSRETVAEIIQTGFAEMTALATTSTKAFERGTLLEYVCRWTIVRTGQPEHLVREVLGCAGRWLDDYYEQLAKQHPELTKGQDN